MESWYTTKLDLLMQQVEQLQYKVARMDQHIDKRLLKLENVPPTEPPPAPATRYRDVTAECEVIERDGVGDQLSIRHNRETVLYTNPDSPYRLRKVPYDTIRIKRTDERPEDCITPGSAFIIEKEEA